MEVASLDEETKNRREGLPSTQLEASPSSILLLLQPFSPLPYLLRPSSRTIVLPHHHSPVSSIGCHRRISSPLKTPASSLCQPSPPPLAAARVLLPRRLSRLPRHASLPLQPASTSGPSFSEAVTTSTPPQLGCHSPFFSQSSLLLRQDTPVSAVPPRLASLSPPSRLHSSSSAHPDLNPTSFMKPAFTKLHRLSPARLFLLPTPPSLANSSPPSAPASFSPLPTLKLPTATPAL